MYRLRVEFPAVGTVYTLTAEAGAYAMTGQAAALSVVIPAPPAVQSFVGAYRYESEYLFQTVASATYPFRVAGGFPYPADGAGWAPTYLAVNRLAGWLWDNPGGDWIDLAGTRQGTVAWGSASTTTTGGAAYSMPINDLIRYCWGNDRWLAIRLRSEGNYRNIAGKASTSFAPPSISVTYADGSTGTLACRLSARCQANSDSPVSFDESLALPCFLEFDRPARLPVSANLNFVVTAGGSPTGNITAWLIDPPINTEPDTSGTGLAASAGLLDEGITSIPGVVGAQRYVDGSVFYDFVDGPSYGDMNAEQYYSPEFWGGAVDTTKLPHASRGITLNGRWHGEYTDGMTLVDSSYTGDGFEPLAPGLGALRIFAPDSGQQDGDIVSSSGTRVPDLLLYMPPDDMGMLDRIFVRYYVRWGLPSDRDPTQRKSLFHAGTPLVADWTSMSGKWGIGPAHQTTYGGVSGTSGGGMGWQMRNSFYDCDANTGGPDENGVAVGFHIYDDFKNNQPVGYRYGSSGQAGAWPTNRERWGAKGGLGATLYAGRWYEIETELKLNSIDTTANTWAADGELRSWVNGRLAFEETGMVFRTAPIYDPGYVAAYLRPMRELGVRNLWMNWHHGGKSQTTMDRALFYTGLVWATERIGRMKTPAVLPTWAQGTSGTWAVIPSANNLDALDPTDDPAINPNHPGLPEWELGGGQHWIIDAWCGAAYDEDGDTMWLGLGGGHNNYGGNEVYRCTFDAATPTWELVRPPSGAIGNLLTTRDGNEITGLYADGRCRAQHGYNKWAYVPGAGAVQVSNGSPWYSSAGGNSKAVFLDPEDGEHRWTVSPAALGVNTDREPGTAAAYDSNRNAIWIVTKNTAPVVRYDVPDAPTKPWLGAYTAVGSSWSRAAQVGAVYLPDDDCLLIVDSTAYDNSTPGTRTVRVFDCATGTVYTPPTSGSFIASLNIGLAQPRYVPALGAVCMWNNMDNRTLIQRMTVPADPRTGTWAIDTLPVSGSNTVTPSAASANGTYGRFAYSPKLGGFILVNSTTGSHYFYKV